MKWPNFYISRAPRVMYSIRSASDDSVQATIEMGTPRTPIRAITETSEIVLNIYDHLAYASGEL